MRRVALGVYSPYDGGMRWRISKPSALGDKGKPVMMILLAGAAVVMLLAALALWVRLRAPAGVPLDEHDPQYPEYWGGASAVTPQPPAGPPPSI